MMMTQGHRGGIFSNSFIAIFFSNVIVNEFLVKIRGPINKILRDHLAKLR